MILDEPHTVQIKVDDFGKEMALPGGRSSRYDYCAVLIGGRLLQIPEFHRVSACTETQCHPTSQFRLSQNHRRL